MKGDGCAASVACPLQHHFRARYKFPSMVTHYASWEYRVAVTKLRLPKCKGEADPLEKFEAVGLGRFFSYSSLALVSTG
jgi:hypothetical protein